MAMKPAARSAADARRRPAEVVGRDQQIALLPQSRGRAVGAGGQPLPARVYIFGHSNGGFMAHRLACSDAERYAAIISLAGAPPLDPAACAPSAPVSVLQIHGDADDTVLFAGGDQILDFTCPYPAATDTVARWAAHDGCVELSTPGEPIDLDASLTGAETAVDRYAGCTGGAAVELWTIAGGSHVPTLRNDVHLAMWTFLSAAAP